MKSLRAFLLLFACAVTPCLAAEPNAGAGAGQSTLDGLRAQQTQLQQELNGITARTNEAKARLREINRDVEQWQAWDFGLRFGLPILGALTGVGLLPAAALFFAVFALLLLVVRRPVTARKLLDWRYAFRVPLPPNTDPTPPPSSRDHLGWIILLSILILILAAPAFGQTASGGQNTAALLRTGWEKLSSDRLVSKQPDGSRNATECFDAVLQADPTNAEARKGLQAVVDRLLKLAIESDVAGDAATAESRRQKAKTVVETHAALGLELETPRPAPAVAATPGETKPAEAPAADKPLREEIGTAVDLMQLSPLERLIRGLENIAGPGITVEIAPDLCRRIKEAASTHGHPPMIHLDENGGSRFNIQKSSLGYFAILASLKETAAKSDVVDTLKRAITSLSDSGVNQSGANAGAIAGCLAKSQAKEVLGDFTAKVIPLLSDPEAIATVALAARDLQLEAVAIPAVNTAITRFSGNRDAALPLVFVLYALGGKDDARALLKELISVANFNQAFQTLKWAAEQKEAEITGSARGRAAYEADVDGLLQLLNWAGSQHDTDTAKEALKSSTHKIAREQDVARIFDAAAAQGLSQVAAQLYADALANNAAMGRWQVTAAFPADLGVKPYDKETISLSAHVGAWLLGTGDKAALRELFEIAVAPGIHHVIDTLGAEPQVPLNDLTALAAYYAATNDPGKAVTDKMVVLQRQLRGLDQAAPANAGDDAAALALQMEISSLRSKITAAQAEEASTASEIESGRKRLAELRRSVIASACGLVAKLLAVFLGLYIALLRATAAARAVTDFRFARFCWTWLETIGFELCCTILLFPAGAVLALLAQDRLKHFRLAEQGTRP